TIEVAVRRRASEVVVSVRDTGAGIPAADLERIFDRFAKADPGRSRHTGGAGLGLSIVRAIAKAHGGSVHVESAEGVGTAFEISLPEARAAAGRREPAREGLHQGGEAVIVDGTPR